MDGNELAYLDERAAAEFRMAQQASSVTVARPHYHMATVYQDRAETLRRRLRSMEQKTA